MTIKALPLLLILTLFFTSCEKDAANSNVDDSAFFGGEIINPYSNYLVLSKNRKFIDTLFLDKKNRFGYTLESLKPGIYNFFDGRETQTFLLQPRDSLRLRLNTIDFDESLVYTGKGAKENNFLVNLFLQNEQEDKDILGISQLNPKEFEKKLHALRDAKFNKLSRFKKKNKPSDLFLELATADINYKYYSNKELYPLANYSKSERDMFESLPEDFYNYRKDVDFNNDVLKDYRPYNSFLRFYVNNAALQTHFKHSEDTSYNEHILDYTLDKLNVIDDKIQNEEIKNGLLNYNIVHFISITKNTEDYDALLESFQQKSTNTEQIARVTRIVNSYKRLKPGKKIPNLKILDKNNNQRTLQGLINKPTVIYFWTRTNKNHLIIAHRRASDLQKKYPEVEFIALNVDSISYKEQVRLLKLYNVRINNEFRFQSAAEAIKVLSVKPINNVFILNGKAEIVNAKANMFNISFEQELLGVINQ
ncbi:hypothetical protein ES677_01040 [Bizionia gelidisalsuginis]|uniref:Thioredoxin domain-containing protein n=1 Tax=Bizionia gelidisalsuginis TaxID=291188 RepID=A0ABY3MEF8_9FLAO|nr:hypothetical protein [Bizionia gelidisalsuginis]TYC17992.1 hypothetical protein ES677_01040 [Bizionia gelidisalsuginis]